MAETDQSPPADQAKDFELSTDYVFLWAYYELKSILDGAYHEYFWNRYLKVGEELLDDRCEELLLISLQMNLRLRDDNKIWEWENNQAYLRTSNDEGIEVGFLKNIDVDNLHRLDYAGLVQTIRDYIKDAGSEDKRRLVDDLYHAFDDKFWFFVTLTYNSKTDYIEAWLPPDGWEMKYPCIISPVKHARRFLSRYKNPLGIGTSSAVILTGEPEYLANELKDPRGRWRNTDIALCKKACIHWPMSAETEDVQAGAAANQKIALGTFGIYSYIEDAFAGIWKTRKQEIERVVNDTSQLLFYSEAAEVRNQFFRIYYSVRNKDTFENKAGLFDEGFVRNDKLLGSQVCATYQELSQRILRCVDIKVSADAIHTYFTNLFEDTQFYDYRAKRKGDEDYEHVGAETVLKNKKIKKFLSSFFHVFTGGASTGKLLELSQRGLNWYIVPGGEENESAPIADSLSKLVASLSELEYDDDLFRSMLTQVTERRMGAGYVGPDYNNEWGQRLAELDDDSELPGFHDRTAIEHLCTFELVQNIPWLEDARDFLLGKIESKQGEFERALAGGHITNAAMEFGEDAFRLYKKLNGVINTIEKLKLERALLNTIRQKEERCYTEDFGEFWAEKVNESAEQHLGSTPAADSDASKVPEERYERLWNDLNTLFDADPRLLLVTQRTIRHRISEFQIKSGDVSRVKNALQNIRLYSQAQKLVGGYFSHGGPSELTFGRYGKEADEAIRFAKLSTEGNDVLMECLDRNDAVCAMVRWTPMEREELVGCYLKRGIEIHENVKGIASVAPAQITEEAQFWSSNIDGRLPVNEHILNLLGASHRKGEYLTFAIDSPQPVKMYSIKNTRFLETRRLFESFYAAVRNIFKGRLIKDEKKDEIDIYIKLLWKMGFGPGSKYEEAILRLAKVIPKSNKEDKIHIVLQGETGTGKEVVANFIHQHSTRGEENFLSHNCAAIPETLFEMIVFGYVPGAYTDAKIFSDGLFIRASDGTLFLDEIGDLSLYQQAKILKALEESAVYRLGDFVPVPIDVRVVAATNRNLYKLMDVFEGKLSESDATPPFRSDLFHRLQYPVELPPLRERSKIGKWLLLVNIFPSIVDTMSVPAEHACRYIGSLKELITDDTLTYGNIRGWFSVLKYMLSFEERDLNKLKDLLEFTKDEVIRNRDAESDAESRDNDGTTSDRAVGGLKRLAREIKDKKSRHSRAEYQEQVREFLTIYLELNGGRIYQKDVKTYFGDTTNYMIDKLAYKEWEFLKRITVRPKDGYEPGPKL